MVPIFTFREIDWGIPTYRSSRGGSYVKMHGKKVHTGSRGLSILPVAQTQTKLSSPTDFVIFASFLLYRNYLTVN